MWLCGLSTIKTKYFFGSEFYIKKENVPTTYQAKRSFCGEKFRDFEVRAIWRNEMLHPP